MAGKGWTGTTYSPVGDVQATHQYDARSVIPLYLYPVHMKLLKRLITKPRLRVMLPRTLTTRLIILKSVVGICY